MNTLIATVAVLVVSQTPSVERSAPLSPAKTELIVASSLYAGGVALSLTTSIWGWTAVEGDPKVFAPLGYLLSLTPIAGPISGTISELLLLPTANTDQQRLEVGFRLGMNVLALASQVTGLFLIVDANLNAHPRPAAPKKGLKVDGISIAPVRDGHQLFLSGSF